MCRSFMSESFKDLTIKSNFSFDRNRQVKRSTSYFLDCWQVSYLNVKQQQRNRTFTLQGDGA